MAYNWVGWRVRCRYSDTAHTAFPWIDHRQYARICTTQSVVCSNCNQPAGTGRVCVFNAGRVSSARSGSRDGRSGACVSQRLRLIRSCLAALVRSRRWWRPRVRGQLPRVLGSRWPRCRRNGTRRFWCRDSAGEVGQGFDEGLSDAALGDALGLVRVDDLAGDARVAVLGRCLRQGVLVDHELVAVPGTFAAGLHVDDDDVVPVEYEQVAWWPTAL